MKTATIIPLPAGRIRRDTAVNRRKLDRSPDTMVNLVESDPGHIARREARRNAYYAAIAQEREEDDQLINLLGMATFFSLTGGTLAVALALIF